MPATLAEVWIVLFVVLMLFLAAAGTVLGTRHALRRRNRVIAGVNSPVPLTWLNSGRREARIHRRLQMSGRRLELVPPTEDVAPIIARLRVELVELDAYLLTVARRPSKVRRADRPEIYERVEQIEGLVRRVEERVRTELVSLDELSERLDLLEAADRELDELGPAGQD
jgi:hypothetical protein